MKRLILEVVFHKDLSVRTFVFKTSLRVRNITDVSLTLLPKEQKNLSWHICLVSPPPTNKTFVRVEQDYVCVGVLTSNNSHVTNTHFAC